MNFLDYAPAPESQAILNLRSDYGLFINGEFVAGRGTPFATISPATEKQIAMISNANAADVDAAVAAARLAHDTVWSKLSGSDRGKYLFRIARLVQERARELAVAESLDNGKPIKESRDVDVPLVAAWFFYYAGWADKLDHAGLGPNPSSLGVAGLITPWNTPFMLESWKLAPALASGCTVVLKPAEFTPLSASLWAEIFRSAGLPDGVFNLVNGIGEEAGDALVKHPDVPLISFTGETTTGQTIYRNCAANLKGMSMELGGKSPAVVFADADLDAAIDSTLFGVFSLNGERCTAGSRILVERSIYDDFCARYAARAQNIVVGDPHDPKTEVGALVHPEHYAKVMSYVEIGKSEGRLLAGGGRPAHLPEGNYVAPTVFADVAPSARIFQEEIFGPVVAITPFDTDEEALELANGVKYGLAAYIWTSNLERAHTFAQSVEAGMVWLNSHNVRDLRTPFGGVKASGLGHEGGYRSIDFYTDQQAVHITLGAVHTARFGAH